MSQIRFTSDNFRAVDPATAAWALQQHFAMTILPIDAGGPKIPDWPFVQPSAPSVTIRTETARQIMAEVCAKHGILPDDLRRDWHKTPVVKARYEFWARCRAEIVIGGAPASWPWIAALTGHDHSTVMRGARLHREAEASA